jgi:hypothetical protein
VRAEGIAGRAVHRQTAVLYLIYPRCLKDVMEQSLLTDGIPDSHSGLPNPQEA